MDKINILLVGSEVGQLKRLRKVLSFNSYDTRIALDINEAISLTSETSPDLIILDMDISDGADYGYRICMNLRKATLCPIIAVSGAYADLEWIRALNSCADHYLVQPFDDDWFKGIVASSLRLWLVYKRDEQDTGEILQRGDLKIDPRARTVSIRGNAVELTKTEFDILYYLARQGSRAIAYSELTGAIWGEEEMNVNSIRSFVSQIRTKIGNDGYQPHFLFTIPGFGYRFSLDGPMTPTKGDAEHSDTD